MAPTASNAASSASYSTAPGSISFTPESEEFDNETVQREMKQRWQDALEHCRVELSREDYQLIVAYKSPEELIQAVDTMITKTQSANVPRILRHLKPHLSQVQNFVVGTLASAALPVVETVCIWGLISLVLELAQRSNEVLETVADMWVEIGNSLQIFEVYREIILEDRSLSLTLLETHEELLKFAVATIKILKHVRSGQVNSASHVRDCQSKFGKTSQYISHRIHIIKERAHARFLTQGQQQARQSDILNYLAQQSELQLDVAGEAEQAKLPCHYIPFPRNPKFHGRDDVLQKVAAAFSKDRGNDDQLRSVALWATAGIGKTQVALEYAWRQHGFGKKVILWIDAEKESERIKAFNDIATLLELPGASGPKDSEQNRLIVQRWLQETKTPWLLIIDNLEDQRDSQARDIMEYICPTHGCGEILMTCRSELVAESATTTANSSIEIPAFTDEEGSELLLKRLNRTTPSEADRSSSLELASLLGGHALTLDVMARSILAKKKQLPDFVKSYKQKPRPHHKKPRNRIVNQYYKRDENPESLWAIPFSQLDLDESAILGVLSVYGPNRIPSSVFLPESGAPDGLLFDEDDFEELIMALRGLSLVNLDETGKLISVHRMIQGEYRYHLDPEQRCRRWHDAGTLLRAAFPRQEDGSTLFNHWPTCELLIEHVMVLATRYRELEEEPNVQLPYWDDFVYLLADAAKYLIECGRYNAAQELISHGFHHCASNVTTIAYTNLCVHMGHVLCERGQDFAARAYNATVFNIREAALGPMHPEVANALSNAALSMVGCGSELEQALAMLERSLQIDLAQPEAVHRRVLHLRHFNLGFALRALGRLEDARRHVDEASAYARAEFGEKSRYLTISYRMYADFALRAGNVNEAYSQAEKAFEIARQEGSITPWVAAALYYLGNIRYCQGKQGEAIEFLDQARVITQLNQREKSDAGEYARVIHKLAQVHVMTGDVERANVLSREAESIYQTLIGTGEYTKSDEERDKWDYLVCLKFR